MDAADSGIELRKAGNSLLDARHPDQNHAQLTFVEDERICSRLFIWSLSASSTTMSVVGSETALLRSS